MFRNVSRAVLARRGDASGRAQPSPNHLVALAVSDIVDHVSRDSVDRVRYTLKVTLQLATGEPT